MRVQVRRGPVVVTNPLDGNSGREYPIHCAICINVGVGPGSRTAATAIVMGYAVCGEHAVLMERQDFEFSRYVQAARSQNKGSRFRPT